MSSKGIAALNTPECDCTNQVEWQVAYFWLVCLALNSMTQPSGRVCGLPMKHRFILRSSPVICGMDGIGVISVWLWHMFWHLEAPKTAARRIARARFRDVEDEAEEESLTSLEKNVPFRYVAFLLGALPQAIKLFASTGTSWIKAWGAMYLGSWIILEALVSLLATHEERRKYRSLALPAQPTAKARLKWTRLRKAWSFGSLAAHSILLVLCTTWYLSAFPRWLFMPMQVMYAFGMCFAYIFDLIEEGYERLASLMPAFFIFLSSFTILESATSLRGSMAGVWLSVAGLCAPAQLAMIVTLTPKRVLDLLPGRLRAKIRAALPFCFACFINAWTLVIYCAFQFNPEGTSIPNWTRWLG